MPPIRSLSEYYTRPDWVRRINAMGDSVGGAEQLIPLDADGLVRAAIDSTGGLDDFGDFDGDWRARFTSLVDELEASGQLHALGRLMTRQELLRGLRRGCSSPTRATRTRPSRTKRSTRRSSLPARRAPAPRSCSSCSPSIRMRAGPSAGRCCIRCPLAVRAKPLAWR